MARGLSSKYVEDFPIYNITAEEFLVLITEGARKTDWTELKICEAGFVAYREFSDGGWSEKITVKIDDRKATLQSESAGNDKGDRYKNKENVHNLFTSFRLQKDRFTSEDLHYLYAHLKDNFLPREEVFGQGSTALKDEFENVLAIFKPGKGYFFTPILINLNIAVFLLLVFAGVHVISPNTESLIQWGADFGPRTLDGEWWRLITSCFLHGGVVHLALNMYAFFFVGLLLEPYLGKLSFIAAYMLTGIIASLTSLWWHSDVVSVGASGAIFGMYGVFLALLTTNVIGNSERRGMLTSIILFVVYNLIRGMKRGIDNAAHIGGLISGVIIGYAMVPGIIKADKQRLKFATVGVLTVVVLTSGFLIFKSIPNDLKTYEMKMREFASMEAMALEVFKLPGNPKETLLDELKERGIYYWKENLRLVESCEALHLPPPYPARNRLLKEYCQLRITSYELLYHAISEGTEKYKDEIARYNSQIALKLEQLNPAQPVR